MSDVPRMGVDQERRVDRTMTFVRNAGIVFLVVAVLGAAALFLVFDRLGGIVATQSDGIVRGYKNRTPACIAILRDPALRLPDVCTESPVLPYVCQAASQTDPAWVVRIEEQLGAPCTWPS